MGVSGPAEAHFVLVYFAFFSCARRARPMKGLRSAVLVLPETAQRQTFFTASFPPGLELFYSFIPDVK